MDLLTQLAADPPAAAIALDVDGVLAPIVARPEDARVPDETRTELRRLNGRYALVACVSGRAEASARAIVGVDGLVYVGNHGLDLHPDAAAWRAKVTSFLENVEWPGTENKGASAALHYRDRKDESAARAALERIAATARTAGFVTRFGRKVLEVLPPLAADKGSAVRTLLAERRLRRALYAGDDTTDLDAFSALDGLEVAVRVAVASEEGPPELRQRADIVVSSPAEFLELLRRL